MDCPQCRRHLPLAHLWRKGLVCRCGVTEAKLAKAINQQFDYGAYVIAPRGTRRTIDYIGHSSDMSNRLSRHRQTYPKETHYVRVSISINEKPLTQLLRKNMRRSPGGCMVDGFRFYDGSAWREYDWFRSKLKFSMTLMARSASIGAAVFQPIETSEIEVSRSSSDRLFSWNIRARRAQKHQHAHLRNGGIIFVRPQDVRNIRQRQRQTYHDHRRDFCWDGGPRYRNNPCPHELSCQYVKSAMVVLGRWQLQMDIWRSFRYWLPDTRQRAVWLPEGKDDHLWALKTIEGIGSEDVSELRQQVKALVMGADDDMLLAHALYRMQTKWISFKA
jgi:hypothetical protein